MIKRYLLLFFLTIFSLNSFAFMNQGMGLFDKKSEVLSASDAFQPNLTIEEKNAILSFNINSDYHVYDDQLNVKVNGYEKDYSGGEKILIDDDFFGKVNVYKYYNTLAINLDDQRLIPEETLNFDIEYQGCHAKAGICYPVEKLSYQFDNPLYDPNFISNEVSTNEVNSDLVDAAGVNSKSVLSDIDFNSSSSIVDALSKLSEKNMFIPFLISFVAGILVAFTPCVYPMIPIISGIVIRNKNESPIKLTSYYVIGIALCYAAIFAFLEIINVNIQTLMMNNITITITGIFLIYLSLVVMGVFNFQMPSSFQKRINNATNNLSSKGSLALIPSGFLSALILSPCATAPLSAMLIFGSLYSVNYGLLMGVLLVFVFGLGVGLPIIAIASSIKKIMPKNGNWMNVVKSYLGVAVLIFGSSMLLNGLKDFLGHYSDVLFVTVLVFSAIHLITVTIDSLIPKNSLKKNIFRYLILIPVVATLIAVNGVEKQSKTDGFDMSEWQTVDVMYDIDKIKNNGKKTIVFVSADWCVVCQKIKDTTLSSESVKASLEEYNKVYVDITKYGEKDDILRYYNLNIAPYFVFYDQYGVENNEKLIGYVSEELMNKMLNDWFLNIYYLFSWNQKK